MQAGPDAGVASDTLTLTDHPRGAIASFRRKLAFWNNERDDDLTREQGRGNTDLEGARLRINGTEVSFDKHNTGRVGTIASPSQPVKALDDNNNRDGYANFVKRQSLERRIFGDDEVDYSADLGRAAASQLWSSDSEESVDEELVAGLKRELSQYSFPPGEESEPVYCSRGEGDPSKTAPVVENQNEPKKKVGGIRRLFSPGLLSGDSRRKSLDHGPVTSTPIRDQAESKPKTVLETAFVSGDKRSSGRSKSVSPSRTTNIRPQEVKSPPSYGVPKTSTNRAKENGKHYGRNGLADNVYNATNRNGQADLSPNLGLLRVDTSPRRNSFASSTSSSSTLVSPQENGPPWVREVNKNNTYSKTPPGYRNAPQTVVQRTHIPVNQSGRVSAPPYIDCCSPYGQDRLLMPVAAQLRITPAQSRVAHQKASAVSQQLRGLLSPQTVRPRGYDPYFHNNTQSGNNSSLESSPGSQNSPKEVMNFNPNVPNLVKPQPVYNASPQRRPRSVSPATGRPGSVPPEYFVRGATQRSTYSGPRNARQSTIYEEVIEEGREPKQKQGSNYGPIFKRGSLYPASSSEGDLNSSAGKRVSFSPSQEQDEGEIYWPTRKGLAPEPPTRRSTRPDETDYVNVREIRTSGHAPDRPLPPIPQRAPSKSNTMYGVVGSGRQRAPHTPTTSRVQALADRWQQHSQDTSFPASPAAPVVSTNSNRWQYQSDTESGSEAGEVQRILQPDNVCAGIYYS